MIDETQKLVLETLQKNKQVIIFASTRAMAEKTAEDLADLTTFNYPEFEEEVLKAASVPTKQCRRLSHCIKKGVVFHHAGLLAEQRNLIENEFRSGKIKVICCTPTLAAGLSLPAFRVIIKSLKRFSGSWGMDWIPVLEYLQMSGRAGRPEYESFGEAIVIAKNQSEKEEIYEKYICGEPENIYSKLAAEPILRTYLLSLISSGIIYDEISLKNFFAKTFWAHQFDDLQKLNEITKKMLGLLREWGFILVSGGEEVNENDLIESKKIENKNNLGDDFISANKLIKNSKNKYQTENLNGNKLETKPENKTFRPTLLGKRVSELYLDPLTAKHLLDCLKNYNETKNVFSLLQMISHTLEMRPLLRVKSKEQDEIQDLLVKNYSVLLEAEPESFDYEYSEYMDSIKTALFFEAWVNEKDENYLLEQYDIKPGEIRVKVEIGDWLLYSAEEIAKITVPEYELSRQLAKLRVRVQNGVKEELLPLLRLKGIGRVRARKLVNNGLKDLGDLKKTDLTTLTQILGKAVAESVLKQLGGEVQEVKKGTRKGQLSIEKFE